MKHVPAKSRMDITAMTGERRILKPRHALVTTDSYHAEAQHQHIQMPQLTTD